MVLTVTKNIRTAIKNTNDELSAAKETLLGTIDEKISAAKTELSTDISDINNTIGEVKEELTSSIISQNTDLTTKINDNNSYLVNNYENDI